jgi:hypothetical protein
MATFNFTMSINDSTTPGSVLAACKKEYEAFAAKQQNDEEAVALAVHALFDEYKGTNINMPALVSATINKLNAPLNAYGEMADRVKAYITANKAVNGTNLNASGNPALFVIGKGRGVGGVRRISDIVVPTV